jgi:hypothetical protein
MTTQEVKRKLAAILSADVKGVSRLMGENEVARVRINGNVALCNLCDLPLGNFNQGSLRGIWNGPAFREFRRRARSPQGLRSLDAQCDYEDCCHLAANRQLHPFFHALGPRMAR